MYQSREILEAIAEATHLPEFDPARHSIISRYGSVSGWSVITPDCERDRKAYYRRYNKTRRKPRRREYVSKRNRLEIERRVSNGGTTVEQIAEDLGITGAAVGRVVDAITA